MRWKAPKLSGNSSGRLQRPRQTLEGPFDANGRIDPRASQFRVVIIGVSLVRQHGEAITFA